MLPVHTIFSDRSRPSSESSSGRRRQEACAGACSTRTAWPRNYTTPWATRAGQRSAGGTSPQGRSQPGSSWYWVVVGCRDVDGEVRVAPRPCGHVLAHLGGHDGHGRSPFGGGAGWRGVSLGRVRKRGPGKPELLPGPLLRQALLGQACFFRYSLACFSSSPCRAGRPADSAAFLSLSSWGWTSTSP
jgi:hypothetical protein